METKKQERLEERFVSAWKNRESEDISEELD